MRLHTLAVMIAVGSLVCTPASAQFIRRKKRLVSLDSLATAVELALRWAKRTPEVAAWI